MSARQTLGLLLAINSLAVGSSAILAVRLGPCVGIGSICLLHAADSACRLLVALGVNASPAPLGLGFLGATLTLPALGLAAMVRRWKRTRAFLCSLGAARMDRIPASMTDAVRETGLLGQLDVIDVPQPIAFAYGLVRPRICISTGLARTLGPAELRAVLAHEGVHRARRDPLWLLLGHGLARTLCWLPGARDLYDHFEMASEVEADAVVAATPGGRATLARALVTLLRRSTTSGLGQGYVVSGWSVTERRVDALLAGTRRPALVTAPERWGPGLGALVVLLCLLLL